MSPPRSRQPARRKPDYFVPTPTLIALQEHNKLIIQSTVQQLASVSFGRYCFMFLHQKATQARIVFCKNQYGVAIALGGSACQCSYKSGPPLGTRTEVFSGDG
jgi:hypothetical protein